MKPFYGISEEGNMKSLLLALLGLLMMVAVTSAQLTLEEEPVLQGAELNGFWRPARSRMIRFGMDMPWAHRVRPNVSRDYCSFLCSSDLSHKLDPMKLSLNHYPSLSISGCQCSPVLVLLIPLQHIVVITVIVTSPSISCRISKFHPTSNPIYPKCIF